MTCLPHHPQTSYHDWVQYLSQHRETSRSCCQHTSTPLMDKFADIWDRWLLFMSLIVRLCRSDYLWRSSGRQDSVKFEDGDAFFIKRRRVGVDNLSWWGNCLFTFSFDCNLQCRSGIKFDLLLFQNSLHCLQHRSMWTVRAVQGCILYERLGRIAT